MRRELEYPIKTVLIPAGENHQGFLKTSVRLYWVCPECNHPRGEIFPALSFDGSLRLEVDGWINPCGHVDKYSQVRVEAAENFLNFPQRRSNESNSEYISR